MPSRLFAPGLLDGQVPIVTGGGSGLGRATAHELAACGAHVVVAGRRLEPLEETAAACEGGRATAICCDVREEDQVEAVENRMRVLSIEWSRFNIRLTALVSGHFDTDALEK